MQSGLRLKYCSFHATKHTAAKDKQVLAVADKHAQRSASWQTWCKQRWMLSVIN